MKSRRQRHLRQRKTRRHRRLKGGSGGYSSGEMLLFHSSICPACIAMKPKWDDFSKSVKHPQIKVLSYETNDPKTRKKLAELGIKLAYVPTIVFVKPKGGYVTYHGSDYSTKALTKWMLEQSQL